MRIVTNPRHTHIHRFLATATSLAGVALLTTSVLLPILRPTENPTPPLSLVVTAIILSSIGLRLSNYWLRTPLPHEALKQGLKGFGAEATLYHYHLPSPHVLVCPQGVFSLTVLPQRVAVHVEGDTWTRQEKLLARLTGIVQRQDTIGNPSRLAKRQARELQEWLDKHLPGHNVRVKPVIVLSNPEARLSAHRPSPPAFYADKRKPSLKAAIQSMPKASTLSSEQIAALEQAAGIAALIEGTG